MEREHSCPCPNHTNQVEKLRENMVDEEILYEVADLFKVFSDSTRIKILYSLFENEFCVCDIAALLDMSQSSISHQLRVLKQSRLVKTRRDGKNIYYSLDDEHVKTIINQGLVHVKE